MIWKKIGKAILFPHIAIMITLVPISAVMLIGSMVFVATDSVIAYISYVVAAYTLTIWCFKIPYLIGVLKSIKNNKLIKRWREDTRLRASISLFGTFFWNVAYGIFQIGLGFYHNTFWFYSLGVYYICLAVMRFFLFWHTKSNTPGEKMQSELKKYRACGFVFLVMNLALAVIVFFMVYWSRTFNHHMITTIAMAAYTFTTLTLAIINVVKYRKYNSPVLSASKAISLAAALVSMLTLESTMLTTFSDESMTPIQQKWMLGATGTAISAFIVAMAIYMIIKSTKTLNYQKPKDKNGKQ